MEGTVMFFVMVGVGEDRPLTGRESRLVAAAIKKHLKDEVFTTAFYGGGRSSWEIVTLATDNQFSLVPIKDSIFSLDRLSREETAKIKQEASADSHQITVKDWLEKKPRLAKPVRTKMLQGMATVISTLDDLGGRPSVLTIAPSPLAESATLNPAGTPILELADIICYEFCVSNQGPCRIVSSKVLKAPAVE